MRLILVILTILACLLIISIIQEMIRQEAKPMQLEQQYKSGAPDPNREVDHFDWQQNKFIYKDEVSRGDKLSYEFQPSLDSFYIEYTDDPEIYVENALVDELQNFIALYRQYVGKPFKIPNRDIHVILDSRLYATQRAIAQCRRMGSNIELRFDKTYWEQNPEVRELLFLHECGHCFLNRPHLDQVLKDHGSPNRRPNKSIMHSYPVNYLDYYLSNREYYLTELFKNQ